VCQELEVSARMHAPGETRTPVYLGVVVLLVLDCF
jgi:hypothetical protein